MEYFREIAPYPIIILLVFLVIHFLGGSGKSRLAKTSFERNAVNYFYPRKTWYLLAIGNYGITVLALYIPYSVPHSTIVEWIVFGAFGGVFALLATVGILKVKNTYVCIGNGELFYKYGRKITVIELSKVKSVDIGEGFIAIDVGEKRRKVIPAIFAGNHDIVALVSHQMGGGGKKGC